MIGMLYHAHVEFLSVSEDRLIGIAGWVCGQIHLQCTVCNCVWHEIQKCKWTLLYVLFIAELNIPHMTIISHEDWPNIMSTYVARHYKCPAL